MTMLEKKLDELLDREAIRDLSQRYCDAVWREDGKAYVDLWTEDGAYSQQALGASDVQYGFRGHAEMLKAYEQLERFGNPRPFCHQIIIDEIGPDHAKGRTYMEIRLAGDNMDLWASGFYQDEFRKVNGAWKFAKRHGVMFQYRPAIKP